MGRGVGHGQKLARAGAKGVSQSRGIHRVRRAPRHPHRPVARRHLVPLTLIDHNGQEGFSAHGNGGLYQGNEIAYNNYNLAVGAGWEAGGGKAFDTRDLTFKANYVHDNGGNGLWADTNNINTTFDDNKVSNNWGAGIYDEISFNATIINNTVTGNGMPWSPGGGNRQGWAWDAGIQLRRSGGLSASTPVIISGNIVANNYNAISLIESPRAGCDPHPWPTLVWPLQGPECAG